MKSRDKRKSVLPRGKKKLKKTSLQAFLPSLFSEVPSVLLLEEKLKHKLGRQENQQHPKKNICNALNSNFQPRHNHCIAACIFLPWRGQGTLAPNRTLLCQRLLSLSYTVRGQRHTGRNGSLMSLPRHITNQWLPAAFTRFFNYLWNAVILQFSLRNKV